MMNIDKKILKTLLELVSVKGIAGTEAESLTATKIEEIIKTIPYFKEHPENLKKVKVEGDILNRSFVSALFLSPKPSKRTIVLTGHLDVVDVDDFGELKDLAFHPLKLKEKIKKLSLNKEVLHDLDSDEWLFGRGTADMKYGLSLGIELMRELSSRGDFEGNLLFLAVPGEESNSEGMIASVPHLLELQKKFNLEYDALFVSECCIPKESEDNTKRIYLGASGKVMPLFLFVGKETHVYEAQTGLNPNLLSSELNRLLELNPNFCDEDRGNFTPPPICLKQTDLKDLYSVQTPLMSAAYYNILTLNLSIDKLMEKLKNLASKAFENALTIINDKVNEYSLLSKTKVNRPYIAPLVLTFDEIYAKVKEIKGKEFEFYIDEKIKQWQKENKDIQTIAINIMKETYMNYPNKVPMIIIGFAPPYYPNKHLQETSKKDMKLLNVIEKVAHKAQLEYHTNIELDHYYMALCDLSYTGVEDKDNLKKIASNIIGINKCYSLPIEELQSLNIPSVVFGGLGKDFHKCTERLNIPYSFKVVPNLYEEAIYEIFKK